MVRRIRLEFNFKTVAIATLLPVLVAGLWVLFAWVQSLTARRYHPRLFTPEVAARYDPPRTVLDGLAVVFKTGDRELLAELEGLRRPRPVVHNPRVSGSVRWQRTDDYWTYMFWDMQTWERVPGHTIELNGRWILAPEDAGLFVATGLWLNSWAPMALVYWLAEVVPALGLAFRQRATRWERGLYRRDQQTP